MNETPKKCPKLTLTARTFVCRIVRHEDRFEMPYVGPFDQKPEGWSIKLRKAAKRAEVTT